MKTTFLLLISALCILAQLPKPFITSKLETGVAEIKGNFTPLPAEQLPELTLKGATAAKIWVDPPRGYFTIELDTELAGGENLEVCLSSKGQTTCSDVAVVRTIKSSEIEITGVEGVYGFDTVTVRFKPIPKLTGEPKITVTAGNMSATESISAKEASAGLKKIKLDSVLAPDLQINASAKNSQSAGPAYAAIVLTKLPTEGDLKVSGTAPESVKHVCIAIISSNFSALETERYLDASTPNKKKSDPNPDKTATCRERIERLRFKRDERGSFADVAGTILEEHRVTVDPKTGFVQTLGAPLGAGMKVFVREVFDTNKGDITAESGPEETVLSSGLDWGRVRANMSLGAAVNVNGENTPEVAPYLSLQIDGSLLQKLIEKKIKQSKGFSKEDFELKKLSFGLHWLTNFRLTQTGTLSSPTAPSVSLNSVQSAVFQMGFYAPVRFSGMDWVYRGDQFTAFFAPIFKTGFTIVENGVLLKSTTTTTQKNYQCTAPPCVTSSTSNTSALRSLSPAPHALYGVRLGVLKYETISRARRNRQMAHSPQMYIDLTWGQDQAYAVPRNPLEKTRELSGQDATGAWRGQELVSVTDFGFDKRLGVEARLKIPNFPVEVGVDLNQAWQRPLYSLGSSIVDGKAVRYSDYRFIVAFRVDAAKTLFGLLNKPAK
jgi:hypothetical protein